MAAEESIDRFVKAILHLVDGRIPGASTTARMSFETLPFGDAYEGLDLTEDELDLAAHVLETAAEGRDLVNQVRAAEIIGNTELDTTNTPEDQAQFAAQFGNLAGQMQDVFDGIDPRKTLAVVLDRREVEMPDAIQALDDVFGDIPDPYADEDGDL